MWVAVKRVVCIRNPMPRLPGDEQIEDIAAAGG
jgi:hypothetical protein